MKKLNLLSALFVGTTLLASCAPAVQNQIQVNKESVMTTQKQQVVDLLNSFETKAAAPVAVINPDKYIQHNLGVADGLKGFTDLVASLPQGAAKVNTVRVFQDGEYVFAHSAYGPSVGFDIFRFENGKIVEHWDNLQQMAKDPNASGHTMVDGSTTAIDLDKTAANKKLVATYVDDFLVKGQRDKLPGYFDGDHYIQHNPQAGDGVAGLSGMLDAMAKQGITMKYDKVHLVLGEGNFVLVVSEGSLAGQHTSYYDLFRVQNGKIAEHWDVVETIPARSEWKNSNGKF